MQPLAIDLYCGLGGWTDGLLAEGYRVIGFDNERHVYGTEQYPGQLVIQDVRTIHGRQLKDAALIVGSSPCQEFSYRAMPWKRAKALPPPVLGLELFEAQFRIQREACEAAGHFIPLVVENVRGAQPYVGRSKYHFGSFHLWGDVPALMPITKPNTKRSGHNWSRFKESGQVSPHWSTDGPIRRISEAHRSKSFEKGYWAVTEDGIKQGGIAGPRANGKGDRWFQDGAATHGSKSPARRRASALIAKIPIVLSRHVAKAWFPTTMAAHL